MEIALAIGALVVAESAIVVAWYALRTVRRNEAPPPIPIAPSGRMIPFARRRR